MFCHKCGTQIPDDSQFCRECGHSLERSVFNAAPPTSQQQDAPSHSIGTIIFASFAVLSLIVSFAKGIVPIYLLEALFWGGLAVYWAKRKPASRTANSIVIFLALSVVAGEAYVLGTRTYQQRGGVQPREGGSLRRQSYNLDGTSQPVDLNLVGSELALMTPVKLIGRCGAPLTAGSAVGARRQRYGGPVLLRRDLSYTSATGSTVTFVFLYVEGAGWISRDVFNGDVEYKFSNDADVNSLIVALPCIAK